MKSDILERYLRSVDGGYIIDITAGKINDLYNDFDKYAPYIKKDLEQALVDYIIDAARDLGREAFSIRFHLLEPPDEEMKARVITSINSYFLYLKNIELRELARATRTSLIFLAVGVTLLSLSVWLHQQMGLDAPVLSRVVAEGLTVAAWVALWQALAMFLINWSPYRRLIKMYDRIAATPIQFM